MITGAASGIGAEIGAAVRRRRARGWSASTSSPGAEGELAIEADVTDEEQVRDDVRAGARASSAGSTCSSTTPASTPTDDTSVLETSLEAWQRVQDVNLRSVFLCCKHGIPHLLEGGGGSVINTASFVAVMGAAVSQISYTASKGARAVALARARGRVRPPRRPRQRALPGPGQHAAARRSCSPSDPEKAARRLVHMPMGRFARGRARSPRRRSSWPATSPRYVTASTFLVDGGLSGRLPHARVAADRGLEEALAELAAELVPGADLRRRSRARSASGSRPIRTASSSLR